MEKTDQIKSWKFIYATPRFGSSIILDMTNFVILYVYIIWFGLPGFATGVATMLGKFGIAISSFFMGHISDKTDIKWKNLGRRKPFVIIGAPLLSFSFVMLFSPLIFIPFLSGWTGFAASEMMLFIWLIVFAILLQASYGLLLTPFQAWMPELTEDNPKIRGKISVYQNTANFLAAGIAAVLGFLLPVLIGGWVAAGSRGEEFFIIIMIFAAINIILFSFSLRLKNPEKFAPSPSLKEELKVAVKDRNYRIYWIAAGILFLCQAPALALILIWTDQVLHFTLIQYLIAAMALLVTIILSAYVLEILTRKIGKRKTLLIGMILMSAPLVLVLPISWYAINVNIYSPIVFLLTLVMIIIFAIGLGAWYLFSYIILADIATLDEIRNGEARAGLFAGFIQLPLNIFSGLGLLLAGALVDPAFFPPISGSGGLASGYLFWGIICAIFGLIGVVILWFIELDFDFEKERELAAQKSKN